LVGSPEDDAGVYDDAGGSMSGAAGDEFGISVSLDGDYGLVGAWGGGSNVGSAYIYKVK